MPHPPSRVSQGLFWSAVRSGQAVEEAGATAGVSFATAGRWFRQRGGVSLWVRGRSQALSLADREEIFAGLNRGRSYAEIARRLGRVTSTVTRELQVNRLRPRYRPAEPVGREKRRTGRRCQQLNYSPSIAHARAEARRGRPKMSKLATNPRLRRTGAG